MASREDQREKALEKICAHLLKTGLAETGVRQLAAAAGISDRMLLYYFANKEEIMGEALGALAGGLSGALEGTIPASEKLSPVDLFRRAAAMTAEPQFRPFMGLWMEILAASQRGEVPYAEISKAIGGGFISWIEQRLATADPDQRRAEAAMLLGMIDGLEILELSVGPEAREAAVGAFIRSLQDSD